LKNIDISIITVNYNGLENTRALIDSITPKSNIEVIVVDNASNSNDADIIEENYPYVRVIRSDMNLGFAGGNNLGIKAAQGKYIFLVNNDTVFRGKEKEDISHFFQPMIDRLDSSPNIGVVCPKIRFSWGNSPIQFAGYTPLSKLTARNHAIGFNKEDKGQYDIPHPTPYAHGAAMMLKREVIDNVGVMPECFFLYYEELDWSIMITKAGYDIWYEPASTIYHKESQTTGSNSPLRTYYITRNRLLLVKRNWKGASKYLSYTYLIFLVAIRDILKYAIKGQWPLCKSVFMGIRDFTFNLQHSTFN